MGDTPFERMRELSKARLVDFHRWGSDFVHTCAHKSRPAGKFGRAGIGYEWPAYLASFTPEQDSTLRAVCFELDFDYSLPRALYPDFKGFWPRFLEPDAHGGPYSHPQADSFLAFFAPRDELNLALIRLLEAKEFIGPVKKKIQKKAADEARSCEEAGSRPKGISDGEDPPAFLEQRDMRRYAAQHLLQVFFEGVGQCEHFKRRRCASCGENFQPAQAGNNFMPPIVCEACLNVRRIPSQLCLGNVKELSENEGKDLLAESAVSAKREFGYLPSEKFEVTRIMRDRYVNGSNPEELGALWVRLSTLPSKSDARAFFGGWPLFLQYAGLYVEERSGKGGYRSFAECGHLCLSNGERAICDSLHLAGVAHEKEVDYPPDPELNPNNRLRCDYRIAGRWVEFAGRMADPEYAARMADKRELLRRSGIELTVITPRELLPFIEKEIRSERASLGHKI